MGLGYSCTLKGDITAGERHELSAADIVSTGESLIHGMGILLMALLRD